MTEDPSAAPARDSAEDEVVDLCRELIRIDTSNYGDDPRSQERKAAEYVVEETVGRRYRDGDPGVSTRADERVCPGRW